MNIAASNGHPGDAPKAADCEDALRPSFQAMADEAIAAGWTKSDVALCLIGLSREYLESAEPGVQLEHIDRLARSLST